MKTVEILNCPDNVESIEITIEEEAINQNHDRSFLYVIKQNLCEYRWEIVAALCIICALVIGLCIFFLTGKNTDSESTTMTMIDTDNFDLLPISTEKTDLSMNATHPTSTTTTKKAKTTAISTQRPSHLDEI